MMGFFRNILQKNNGKKGLMLLIPAAHSQESFEKVEKTQDIGTQLADLAVMGESQGVFHPAPKCHGFRRKKDNGPVVFTPQHNGWVVVSNISMFIPS